MYRAVNKPYGSVHFLRLPCTFLLRGCFPADTVGAMEMPVNETGWRGSPEVWLEAAYDALVESGVDAVRIQPMARKLNLSRTSFYWFYKGREELLAALIERWRVKNTGSIVRQTEAYAESIAEAVLNVFDCWLDRSLFDAELEYSIRSWAIQSPDVAAEIHSADAARIAALAGMFVRFGYDPLAADVRARTIYLVQIGYISMRTREDIATRALRIPAYVEIFTGQAPQGRELQRFFSRHGHVAEETGKPPPLKAVGSC